MKYVTALVLVATLFATKIASAQPDCDPSLRSDLGAAAADAQLIQALGRIKLGPFEVSQIPPGALSVTGVQFVGPDIFFTFSASIDARQSARKPTFTMAGNEVEGGVIRGQVRRLNIKGCITIPGRTLTPRIEVPKGNFFAEVLTPEARIPTSMAGVLSLKGNFVELRNTTAVRLSTESRPSSGTFEIAASDATTDTIEVSAEGSTRTLTLKAMFHLPGTSRWSFDLSSPQIKWLSGAIQASQLSLEADSPYMLPLPKFDLEFKKLQIANIRLLRGALADMSVSIAMTGLELNAGRIALLGAPRMSGKLISPLRASGQLTGKLTKDGQITIDDYAFTNVGVALNVADFSDGGILQTSNTSITLDVQNLTKEHVSGQIKIVGGQLVVKGPFSGSATVNAIDLRVDGRRDALNGTGRLEFAQMSFAGSFPIEPLRDKCPGKLMNIDVKGAQATNVVGNIQLVEGKTKGAIQVGDLKAAAKLPFFQCDWDHVVGHLNKVEMNGIPYPCPTWSEPFRSCQDKWVLWDGGDVKIRYVATANPTLTDVGIQINNLKYNLENERVCGGTISGLTTGLWAISVTPNLPASGTVLDVFRDAINILAGGWQTALVNSLGPAIGGLGVVELECK